MNKEAPSKAFWQGRNVLVTGHTGFKGAWLCQCLVLLGARVTGYSLPPEGEPSLYECCQINELVDSHFGNINDKDQFEQVVKGAQPEIVFHLAAQPLVRESYKTPVETFSTNLMGTVHLLDILRRTDSTEAAVFVTTDKCYENKEWLWGYRENDPLGGYDPYSASKACAELAVAAYRQSFFTAKDCRETSSSLICSVGTARAGNVIGGGDWSLERLLPDAMRSFAANDSLEIRYPHATRPWQHVLEPLAGYLLLAQGLFEHAGEFAEAWNFGPDNQGNRAVGEVVDMAARYWGDGATWHQTSGEHPHEAGLLKLECSKAVNRLGWQATWTLEESVERVVRWHKAFNAGQDMREYSSAEINSFMSDYNKATLEHAVSVQPVSQTGNAQ